ncbi:MAG: hypothetical protein GY865_08880 [candidate division Zixibacteria bacterium]|nr:hypothetical protein [candidate division Zixibacteria bacterium]
MTLTIKIFFVIIILFVSAYTSQSVEEKQSLPIGLTDEEKLILHKIGRDHIVTSAPSGEIRNPGEWEPSEGVIIRYPLGLPIELVVEMAEDLIVYTIVSSGSQEGAASYYTSSGVNMNNVEFIIAPTNSIWTRDYGPWFIFDGSDQLGIVDHIYNRPRPDDDDIPGVIGTDWSVPVYGLDLIHAGGNHMSNGLEMSMSTELVIDENPLKTESEVETLMSDYLGNDYTVLSYIESGGIHHIDCWAKFLSPSTIMVKDVPPSSSSYDLLNDRADYLSQQMSPWGRPYTVVRIYCPIGTAYTNSIILNNKVFVPLFGGGYTADDDAALAFYEAVMPGYEILRYYGSWYSNDAIHCRTMGVPDREMLYINHMPIYVTNNTIDDYLLSVKIKDLSGTGLIPESLNLFYQLNGIGGFTATALSSTAVPDSFTGYIPAQPFGTEISYYISAEDNSGRVETHPYIGEDWAHQFKVNSAPQIISADSFLVKAPGLFGYCPEIDDFDDETFLITYSGYPEWMFERNDSLIGSAPEANDEILFLVDVSDNYYPDNQNVKIVFYLCGDVDYNNDIDILDIVFLINNIYKNGADPQIIESANIDSIGTIDILDIVYLINYLYKDGPDPICI